jgi:hypothetical protein
MRSIDERYKDHCRLAVTERWWCRTKERDKGVENGLVEQKRGRVFRKRDFETEMDAISVHS